MDGEKSDRIKLVLSNGRAMIFNADDYIKLRTDHRIIGKLIGVGRYPRNVNVGSMPVFYSEYETKLMIDENIADLIEKSSISKPPTQEMKNDHENFQQNLLDEFKKPIIDSRMESINSNMEAIIKGKIKKLIKAGVKEQGTCNANHNIKLLRYVFNFRYQHNSRRYK
jgi:hypothetical protein